MDIKSFKITHVVLMLVATVILYYSTSFWIGSQEDYLELKNNSMLNFFTNRFLLNLIVIVVFILFSLIISKVLWRGKSKFNVLKLLITELAIMLLLSIMFIFFKEMM